MNYNGKEYEPFTSAFSNREYTGRMVGQRISPHIPHRNDKVTSLDAVMEVINDGDTISYPHYYRTGDKGLEPPDPKP